MSEPPTCRLKLALGEHEPCPDGRCAFWEPGVDGGRCGLERFGVKVSDDPALAAYLLEVRRGLEAVRTRPHAHPPPAA